MQEYEQIDAMLRALEIEFRREVAAREEQYLREKSALESTRAVVMRFRSSSPSPQKLQTGDGSASSPIGSKTHPVVSGVQSRRRKARDLVREVAMKMPMEFTVRQMVEAAALSADPQIQAVDEMTFHSTMTWFKKYHLVEVVQERKSKTEGSVYRITSPGLKRPLSVSKRNSSFPLLDMVREAVNALSPSSFGKQEAFEKTRELHPEFAERIHADSVSATLNKLANAPHHFIRRVSKGTGARSNSYEKI